MQKKIIVQGRPLTFLPSGNRTFTTNFLQHLCPKLPQFTFEILVPVPLEDTIVLPQNCKITLLPQEEMKSDVESVSHWEQEQVYEYAENANKEETVFFLSTHHSLPDKKLSMKSIMILHDIHLWKYPDANQTQDRKDADIRNEQGVQNADYICTVSDFTRREVLSYFTLSDTPVHSIYEDIDPYYKEKNNFEELKIIESFGVKPQNYFLYIGSFDKRKNIEVLEEAYRLYRIKSDLKKDLLIFSTGWKRSESATSIGGSEGVHLLKIGSKEELYGAYQHSAAFIYPSLYEGFGLQILEANNVGCPMLASDIDIFHEVGENGVIYFDPHSAQDLCQKMIELEQNTTTKQELLDRGRQNALRYSWEKTTDLFMQSIETLLQ